MPAEPNSGRSSSSLSVQCPSCGRFVGPLSRCPHCGAPMPRRMSLRIFRWSSVFLATVGLALLYAMVRARDIPLVQAGDIAQTMNFASIRVSGEVAGETRVFRSDGRIEGVRFDVSDGTGVVTVMAWGSVAEALEREKSIPRRGDQVSVSGSLQVNPTGTTLWVRDESAVRLEPRPVPQRPVARIHPEDSGPVLVRGRVVSIRKPRPQSRAPWEIVMEDESGTGTLVFFDSVSHAISDENRPEVGTWIEARVTPETYRGRPQLRVGLAEDIRRIPAQKGSIVSQVPVREEEVAPNASPGKTAPVLEKRKPIAQVTLAEVATLDEGTWVEVEADVVQVKAPPIDSRAPWQVTVRDESGGTVPLVYWSDVAERLAEKTPRPGQRLIIRARRDAYRGTVQLRLRRASDLRPAEEEPVP